MNNQDTSPDKSGEAPRRRWRFGNLLDDAALKEIREFNQALADSKNSETILVNNQPPVPKQKKGK